MIEYAFAIAAVALSTALSFAFFPFLHPTNLVMIYLLGTMAVASRGHRGPAAVSAALSVLSFDFFFIPPRFTFTVNDAQYIVTFVGMFLTAMIISHLTIRLRSEASEARQGQMRTAMMHAFTQQLANERHINDVLRITAARLAETFNGDVVAFVPGKEEQLDVKAISGGEPPTEKEHGVAKWVYDRGLPAGLGTTSLPVEDALYVPLIGALGPVGVLRVKPRVKESLTGKEQRLLLDSFAHQAALAMEVDRLQESARQAEIEMEGEKMRSALLSSVSHDFRTPLTAIVGSASTLLGKAEFQKNPKAVELLVTIQQEGDRLSRLVQNLLETTRLESGGVHLRKELYPLEEIIGSALERLAEALKARKVIVKIPDDLPSIPLDALLLEQVFINLVENAHRHTPIASVIEISAVADNKNVTVSVADNGPGLAENELERVFDKFYHGKSSPGAGLGLAICRAIINAHGGRIWAENRTGGGAIFQFTLPFKES